jgi:hypothetical protein
MTNDIVNTLSEYDNLLDIAIEIEDYFDSLDLYAFENWLDGEIVEGPTVKKYWISITLKYPHKKMPDPEGGLRLIKYGSTVGYERALEEVPTNKQNPGMELDNEGKPKVKKQKIWLIHVKIPRRLIKELNVSDLELKKRGISPDYIKDAQASGITDETGINQQAQAPTPDGPVDMGGPGAPASGGAPEPMDMNI